MQRGAARDIVMYPTAKVGLPSVEGVEQRPKAGRYSNEGQPTKGRMHIVETTNQAVDKNMTHFFFVKMDGYLKQENS